MDKKNTISVNLTKKEILFFESFGKRCRLNNGRKLSRNEILRAMIKVLKNLKLNPSGLKDDNDLVKRIYDYGRIKN